MINSISHRFASEDIDWTQQLVHHYLNKNGAVVCSQKIKMDKGLHVINEMVDTVHKQAT